MEKGAKEEKKMVSITAGEERILFGVYQIYYLKFAPGLEQHKIPSLLSHADKQTHSKVSQKGT